jgi:signal peptidase I
MQPRRARKLVLGGLGLIALSCLWLSFAPVGLGGSTSYVVTDGTSMEPRFHAGDLAIVRSQSSYRVGEIVAYDNIAFHTIVLHRIVAISGARYVFKGDNNDFVDFEHPARSQLIGALWLGIPGAGARLESLRSPALVGVLIGVATLLLSGAAFTTRRRRRRRRRAAAETGHPAPARRQGPAVEPVVVLAVGLLALLPFLALTLLSFTRPANASLPLAVPYAQSGALSYTAGTAPGPIYPGNRAVTGEPLFTHVVDSVQLRFAYRFRTAARHSLTGRVSLSATIASTSGWQKTFALAPPAPFRGDRAVLDASLDLRSLLALLRRVEATTAVSGSYTLTLTPRVSTSGSLDALALHATFAPQIRFAVNQLEVQPAVSPGGSAAAAQSASSQFQPSAHGSAAGRSYQPFSLSLGLARVPVQTARTIALGGFAAVLCATLAMLALIRPRRRSESEAIIARHGRAIVAVERVWQLPGAPIIDVGDIDALLRIAEHYDRAILYEAGEDGEAFWVTDESGQFRYALGTASEAELLHYDDLAAAEEECDDEDPQTATWESDERQPTWEWDEPRPVWRPREAIVERLRAAFVSHRWV